MLLNIFVEIYLITIITTTITHKYIKNKDTGFIRIYVDCPYKQTIAKS